MKKSDPFKVRKSRKDGKKPKTAKDLKKDLSRAVQLMYKIQAIKDCYKELDVITQDLLEHGFVEGFIEDKHVVMKDLFSVKNTVWKSTPSRRFELEIA